MAETKSPGILQGLAAEGGKVNGRKMAGGLTEGGGRSPRNPEKDLQV